MKRLQSFADMDWIKEGVIPHVGDGCSVASCIPAAFPAYAKLFHPICEDLSVADDGSTWQDEEVKSAFDKPASKSPTEQVLQDILREATTVYGGAQPSATLRQIRWAKLAEQLDMPFVATLSSWSFTRRFPGGSWPRRLIGPDEGFLQTLQRDMLAKILRRHAPIDHCFFFVWHLATTSLESDLIFEGSLSDVSLFPDKVDGVRFTPTNWFPADRTWLIHTDYDLTFTLIGGSQSLVDDLITDPFLECVAVQPETRVDYKADL